MSELQEIKDDVKVIKSDVKEGFAKMNGRVKDLEIKQAYREGRADAVGILPENGEWKKATFKLIGIIAAIVTLATVAAGIVAKAIQ